MTKRINETIEEYKARERLRNLLPKRKAMRRRAEKKYRQTSKKDKLRRYIYKQKIKTTPIGYQKYTARRLAQIAVLKGLLIKSPCQYCGIPKTEGHHNDYNKPLEVIWLCSKCHQKLHQDFKAPKKNETCLETIPHELGDREQPIITTL